MSVAPEFSKIEQPEGEQPMAVVDDQISSDGLILQPVPSYISRHLDDLAIPAVNTIQRELFALRMDQTAKMARWAMVRRNATEHLFREFEMLSSDTSSALFSRVFNAIEQEVATSKRENFDNLRSHYRGHPAIVTFEMLRTKSQSKLVKLTAITMQRTAYLLISRHTPDEKQPQ